MSSQSPSDKLMAKLNLRKLISDRMTPEFKLNSEDNSIRDNVPYSVKTFIGDGSVINKIQF